MRHHVTLVVAMLLVALVLSSCTVLLPFAEKALTPGAGPTPGTPSPTRSVGVSPTASRPQPAPTASAGAGLVDALKAMELDLPNAQLRALAQGILVGDLLNELTVDGPVTLLAPSDDAFAALEMATVDMLVNDREQLAEFVRHHVISGTVTLADLAAMPRVSLAGQTLAVTQSGGVVRIDGAQILQGDIAAPFGLVHVIDRVLWQPEAPSATVIPVDTPTRTPTAVPTAAATATLTPTSEPTTEPTAEPTAEPTVAATPSATQTPTPTAGAAAQEATPAATVEPTRTLAPTVTAEPTRTVEPTATAAPTEPAPVAQATAVPDKGTDVPAAPAGAGAPPSADKGPSPEAILPSLRDGIAGEPRLSEFRALVERASLEGTIYGGGARLVVAPVNEAWKALPEAVMAETTGRPEALSTLLRNHVLLGSVYPGMPEGSFATSGGQSLRVSTLNGVVIAGGAVCESLTVYADGVLCVANRVLIPGNLPLSLLGRVHADTQLTVLAGLVSDAGLEETLCRPGLTLLAPTDTAFGELTEAEFAALTLDRAVLRAWLERHILNGSLSASRLGGMKTVGSLSGETLPVRNRYGKLIIRGTRVLQRDVPGTNGMLHTVDTVVLP